MAICWHEKDECLHRLKGTSENIGVSIEKLKCGEFMVKLCWPYSSHPLMVRKDYIGTLKECKEVGELWAYD